MTRYEELLAEVLLGAIRGLGRREAVQRLLAEGLVNRRACERLAVRCEVARLEGRGIPRCEALCVAAETCCCSYEKARALFYENTPPAASRAQGGRQSPKHHL